MRGPTGLGEKGAGLLIGQCEIAAVIPLWRRLDDMARDAHTTAWYWGGSAGLGVGLLSLIALTGVRSPFVGGAMFAAGLQLAGYGVCWVGWWAMRRPRDA